MFHWYLRLVLAVPLASTPRRTELEDVGSIQAVGQMPNKSNYYEHLYFKWMLVGSSLHC